MTIGELLKIEIASVRANLLPMVVLWGLAGATVAAYDLMPGTAGALKVFADWQTEYGKLASFANRFVCGGEMAMLLDSEGVGRMAAKELLSLGLDNFAFVPFRLPMYWGEERARGFEADVKAAGKSYFQFKRPYAASPAEQRGP